MSDPTATDGVERAAALAERLRLAHRGLAAADLPDSEKASLAARLVKVSDTAKRDVDRAAAALDAVEASLRAVPRR